MTEEIKIIKSKTIYGKILVRTNPLSAVCSICGVISNLFPDYEGSDGTSVHQILGYCGHNADGYFEIKEQL